jgi:hypothetical protein
MAGSDRAVSGEIGGKISRFKRLRFVSTEKRIALDFLDQFERYEGPFSDLFQSTRISLQSLPDQTPSLLHASSKGMPSLRFLTTFVEFGVSNSGTCRRMGNEKDVPRQPGCLLWP